MRVFEASGAERGWLAPDARKGFGNLSEEKGLQNARKEVIVAIESTVRTKGSPGLEIPPF